MEVEEQRALAAKQKEEDTLALQKYQRADEYKIKEMNLNLEGGSRPARRALQGGRGSRTRRFASARQTPPGNSAATVRGLHRAPLY